MTNSVNNNSDKKFRYPFSLQRIVHAMDRLPDNFDPEKGGAKKTVEKNGNKYFDGKISASVYNHFAETIGIKKTNEKYVSSEFLLEVFKILGDEAPEIIINYMIRYLDYPPEKIENAVKEYVNKLKQSNSVQKPKQTKTSRRQVEAEDKTSLLKTLGFFSKGSAPIMPGMYAPVEYDNERSKRDRNQGLLLTKPDEFISNNSIATVQETVRGLAESARLFYPLSSRLLRLSVTPSEMTVGKHNGYRVLSPEESRQKLEIMGMRENDRTWFMGYSPHLTSDKMGYKTVVFDENSKESKSIKNDTDLIEHVTLWLEHRRLKNKYYTGVVNDELDYKLAINQCMYAGMRYIDNGNSYTVTGFVEDIYDFSEKNDGYSSYGGTTGELNHIGFLSQKKGAIQPYRVLIPFTVTIPKSSLK